MPIVSLRAILHFRMLIDTHCHLYLPEFDTDREGMMQRAFDAGVGKFFLPNIDNSTITLMLELSKQYPGSCYPMMGLHPGSVKEDWQTENEKIEKRLSETSSRWFGIGETGLDYYWDKTFIPQQKENFQRHIEWAKQYHLPLIIHSRDALDDCIEMVKRNNDQNLRGIFHCFSGTAKQAEQIISMDFYLGIGGVLTFKNSGLDKALEEIALSSIVLETDAPYLAPVPFRGKRNESSYLSLIVKKIAEIKKITEEEVSTITTQNAEKVFQVSV